MSSISDKQLPESFQKCIDFHGHMCPGLVYGYIVATEALKRLGIQKSTDEEIYAVSENDSCAVDALQVILGTTAGKGNLKIDNYGKNAFTVYARNAGKAFRFSRKTGYTYTGEDKALFELLEKKMSDGILSSEERALQKKLKTFELLDKTFSDIFDTEEKPYIDPPYAELARSVACVQCNEMTMATKMKADKNGKLYCIQCFNKR